MDAETLLKEQRVARLATVSKNGRPHIVPVVFAYSGAYIYIALDDKPKRTSPMRLKRVRNILASPRVSMLVDHYEEDWGKLAWVRVDGAARILASGEVHEKAIGLLRAKYPQYRAMRLESRPVIEIAVERVVQWSSGAGGI